MKFCLLLLNGSTEDQNEWDSRLYRVVHDFLTLAEIRNAGDVPPAEMKKGSFDMRRGGGIVQFVFQVIILGLCCTIIVLHESHHTSSVRNLRGRMQNIHISKHYNFMTFSILWLHHIFTVHNQV